MKIFASSDFHGNLPQVPDCDLFLIAGDVCPDFGDRTGGVTNSRGLETNGLQQSEWLDSTFRDWLNELSGRGIRVVGIWGNHDFVGEHSYLVPGDLPWTLLQDDIAVVDGLRIWGTPWCPKLKQWAFYARSEALYARANNIPACDILLCHTPPLGAGDMVGPHYGGPLRVGDVAMADVIRYGRLDTKLYVCGHIHEDHGVHYLTGAEKLPIMNVSYVNEFYEPVNPPVEINLGAIHA